MSRLAIRWGTRRFVSGSVLFICLTAGWASAAAAGSTAKTMSGRWKSNAGQSGTWASRRKPRPRNVIKVRGPTSNTYHKSFNETVSGFATGAANYVVSGEQLYPKGGCAKTYTVEKARSDWYQWPTGTGAVKGKFSLVAKFYARNHKTHGICSYLINSGTKKTFAHASRFWHNS